MSDGPTSRPSFPLRALFRIVVGEEQEVLVDEVGKTRRSRSVGVGSVGGVYGVKSERFGVVRMGASAASESAAAAAS